MRDFCKRSDWSKAKGGGAHSGPPKLTVPQARHNPRNSTSAQQLMQTTQAGVLTWGFAGAAQAPNISSSETFRSSRVVESTEQREAREMAEVQNRSS